MRDAWLLTFLFLALTLSGSAAATWVPSLSGALRSNPVLPQDQQPIMNKILPDIIKPQTATPKEDLSGQADGPVISDVLPKTKGINIFASLTRDFDPIASRLNDASKNITVLAPRNSAVQDLPRKPWEDPEEYQQQGVDVYEGQGGQDRARRNLQRFVEAHLLPASPWRQGEEIETLGGEKLKWMKDGDKILIQPGNIEVDSIAEKVANGEVWILNGVVNYRT
ncbi:uncharacterized protein N7459_002251 [Penicillium hispanicum]|uniref:uncharacterized protein n=1 Tax=Penicillium hispanicum TaxID=1080232 RepID=UPI0025414B05|nr:uncharacterized protein N7459_002251 [Penicillium hispanicum]KAJ5591882.1 hypothetical protein N7459_002251 [Penicillium hispanicum]